MTALNRFYFSGYCLRPAVWDDLPLAVNWTYSDPDHSGKVMPEFWIRQSLGNDAYVLQDGLADRGETIFYLKLVTAGAGVELHIQFDPNAELAARVQRAELLGEGLQWLERTLRGVGTKEIFFRSHNTRLILFAVKRLGFVSEPPVDGETILRKALCKIEQQSA